MSEVPVYYEAAFSRTPRPLPALARGEDCRGTSLIRNTPLLGPYSRSIHRVIGWS